mmetsp:Transcript_1234/g.2065  ORF Transcript_1234/g.2065 Transcript_1234/m.2065 type:complete len:332 (-) Transcript_1234:33-1028(-)
MMARCFILLLALTSATAVRMKVSDDARAAEEPQPVTTKWIDWDAEQEAADEQPLPVKMNPNPGALSGSQQAAGGIASWATKIHKMDLDEEQEIAEAQPLPRKPTDLGAAFRREEPRKSVPQKSVLNAAGKPIPPEVLAKQAAAAKRQARLRDDLMKMVQEAEGPATKVQLAQPIKIPQEAPPILKPDRLLGDRERELNAVIKNIYATDRPAKKAPPILVPDRLLGDRESELNAAIEKIYATDRPAKKAPPILMPDAPTTDKNWGLPADWESKMEDTKKGPFCYRCKYKASKRLFGDFKFCRKSEALASGQKSKCNERIMDEEEIDCAGVVC